MIYTSTPEKLRISDKWSSNKVKSSTLEASNITLAYTKMFVATASYWTFLKPQILFK